MRAQTVHSTSPAAVIQLPPGCPGGTEPWGFASSGNVAVHTGCHLFESSADGRHLPGRARRRDALGVLRRRAQLPRVRHRRTSTTATGWTTPTAAGRAIAHLKNDGARLVRIHLQRIRDVWTGPADKTNPRLGVPPALVTVVDRLLGDVIQALKDGGASGTAATSSLGLRPRHGGRRRQRARRRRAVSWNPVLAFYGPGLKKGATIPYAELPDVAVTVAHLLGAAPAARPARSRRDPAGAGPHRYRPDQPVRGRAGRAALTRATSSAACRPGQPVPARPTTTAPTGKPCWGYCRQNPEKAVAKGLPASAPPCAAAPVRPRPAQRGEGGGEGPPRCRRWQIAPLPLTLSPLRGARANGKRCRGTGASNVKMR